MTVYLSNRDGNGKTNEEGHFRLQTRILKGGTLGDTSLDVVQNSPLGMSVLVSSGDYRIETSAGYSYTGWLSANETVAISTADPANPRITTIVIYVDKNAATSASPPNNPGISKLLAVNGTPAASPTAPNSTVIQTAVGAGNPYIELAQILVGTAVTQITDANITDVRELISLNEDVLLGTDILATVGPLLYPVGTIYTNYSNSTNPGTLFGFGTWSAMSGRVVVGLDGAQTEFDTAGETGGSKTHTLTTAEMPAHAHRISLEFGTSASLTVAPPGQYNQVRANGSTYYTASGQMENTGGGGAHNNLQPYVVAYMWRRVS